MNLVGGCCFCSSTLTPPPLPSSQWLLVLSKRNISLVKENTHILAKSADSGPGSQWWLHHHFVSYFSFCLSSSFWLWAVSLGWRPQERNLAGSGQNTGLLHVAKWGMLLISFLIFHPFVPGPSIAANGFLQKKKKRRKERPNNLFWFKGIC